VQDIYKASLQAANLILINIILLFSRVYLSFLADLLGVLLDIFRLVYKLAVIIASFLIIFYIVTILT
ncbi:hypothetical protein P154DRAFT_445754, partial [Amniculicola lignicola CBS 123094]